MSFLLTQLGCPVTCIVSPHETDLLTTSPRVTIDGVLLEYDENFELNGPASAGTDMPCSYVYYRENILDYENQGAESFSCNTTSGMSGLFSLNLDLDEDKPGLYKFSFASPITQSETRLITLQSDLRPAPDQYVYFDWEYDASSVIPRLATSMREWLAPDSTEAEGLSDEALVDLVKIELERVVIFNFFGFRVYLTDEPGPDIQTYTMANCRYDEEDEDGNCVYFGLNGECSIDYGNLNPSEPTCRSFVGTPITLLNVTTPSPSRDFSLEEIVISWGNNLGRVATHELGHAMGLVSFNYLYGNNGSHDPWEPSFLSAVRYIPQDFMVELFRGSSLSEYRCDSTRRRTRSEQCYQSRWNSFNWQYLQLVQ